MKKVIASVAVLLPLITLAHPGHGETEGYTITHYFTEPQHAVITLGTLVVAAVFIARERRRRHSDK